jgi:hypothetical protein
MHEKKLLVFGLLHLGAEIGVCQSDACECMRLSHWFLTLLKALLSMPPKPFFVRGDAGEGSGSLGLASMADCFGSFKSGCGDSGSFWLASGANCVGFALVLDFLDRLKSWLSSESSGLLYGSVCKGVFKPW